MYVNMQRCTQHSHGTMLHLSEVVTHTHAAVLPLSGMPLTYYANTTHQGIAKAPIQSSPFEVMLLSCGGRLIAILSCYVQHRLVNRARA